MDVFRGSRGATSVAVLAMARSLGAVVAIALALAPSAGAAEDEPSFAFTTPSSLSPVFGLHQGLRGATDEAGQATLAWTYAVGAVHEVQSAATVDGANEPVRTLARTQARLSTPALAESPAGAVAIAWFEIVGKANGGEGRLVSLRASIRASDGRWEAPRTVWRPSSRERWAPGHLTAAIDDAGDVVVAWSLRGTSQYYGRESTVFVASRKTGEAFTRPAVLTRTSFDIAPAVAIEPGGEATMFWSEAIGDGQLLATAWTAGSDPSSSRQLLGEGADAVGEIGLHDLALAADSTGAELATWLAGSSYEGRPRAVALHAAWRAPGAAFTTAQTISPTGVEAREPAVAISPERGALIVWSEITALGAGPELRYATGPPGAPLVSGAPTPAPTTFAPTSPVPLEVSWLPEGNALISWREGDYGVGAKLFAARWQLGGALSAPTLRARVSEGPSALAASADGAPLIAWVGSSPVDFSDEAVRYSVAEIGGSPPAHELAPLLALSGSRYLADERRVDLRVGCAEPCSVTAKAAVYALLLRQGRRPAAGGYRELGALSPSHAALAANAPKLLRLRVSERLLARYCRSVRSHEHDAVEVQVRVRSDASGAAQRFALGLDPVGGRASCDP